MDQVLEDKLLVKYNSPKSDTKKKQKNIWVNLFVNKQNPYYKNFPLRKLPATNASTSTELRNDSHSKIKEEREGECRSWLHLSNPPLLQSLHLHPLTILHFSTVVPGGSEDNQDSACNAGDPGLIPRWGRSPRERNGNTLQYSCLVHGVTKSRTGLKQLGMLAPQSFKICVFPPRSSTWTPWNLLVISNKLLYILLWSLFPL